MSFITGCIQKFEFPRGTPWKNVLIVGLGLTLGWFGFLACCMHALVAGYYPIGDQWALLANSYPGYASPIEWITKGFSEYFVFHPGLSQPYANFIRPFFNATYWLMGHFFPLESGAYLYFNYVVIGACAGLAYVCMVSHARPGRLELPLAATVPFMPSLLPTWALLFVPCLAFDPLVACLSLLAYLAYNRNKLILTSLILLVAVFTKETALPVAVAIPVVYLLGYYRAISSGGRWTLHLLLLLSLPVLLWLGLRLSVFGNVSGGVYVLSADPAGILRRLVNIMVRWPFWFEGAFNRQLFSPTRENLPALLTIVANMAAMGAAGLILALRVWKHRSLDLAEVCFVFSYGFMLMVGVSPRFGVVLDVFMVIAMVRWVQQSSPILLKGLLLAGFALGLVVTNMQTWREYPGFYTEVNSYHEIARRYVTKLREFAPGQRVVVMNDPASWHSDEKWLVKTAGIQADVIKIADFVCPGASGRLGPGCPVSLAEQGDSRHFKFTQECGIDICGVAAPNNAAAHVEIKPDLSVDLIPSRETNSPQDQSVLRWRSFTFSLNRGDVYLLYFDPVTNDFRQLYVP